MIAWGFIFLLVGFVSAVPGFTLETRPRAAGWFRILLFVGLSLFLGLTVVGLSHSA
jgi:uncharacterized membrane protein YtjA (UPF0391 family)